MKDLTWLKTEYIAHRGLYTKDQSVPENSLLAFKKALDLDYAIELDVNLLKDETVVVFHDHTLKRMCGSEKSLDELTYEEISQFDLYNSEERIPKLSEVLDLVDGKKPILIELKPHGNVNHLTYQTMQVLKDYKGKYAIFSFHPTAVSLLKKYYPDVIRGQITEYFKDNKHMNKMSKYLMKSMFFNRFSKPDFISYGIEDLPNKYADKAKKDGLTVISYAARAQDEFDFVKRHYDNVVFEYFIPKK